jgi:hypothetical protein
MPSKRGVRQRPPSVANRLQYEHRNGADRGLA